MHKRAKVSRLRSTFHAVIVFATFEDQGVAHNSLSGSVYGVSLQASTQIQFQIVC